MPGERIEYQFSETANLSNLGDYDISAWILDNPDQNVFNDSSAIAIEVIEGMSTLLPHTQNFNTFTNCNTQFACNVPCNVSNGYVNLENTKWDDINWRTHSGATPSSGFLNTGTTTGDFDLNGSGRYLYLESIEGCTFQVGKLVSPCMDVPDVGCCLLYTSPSPRD